TLEIAQVARDALARVDAIDGQVIARARSAAALVGEERAKVPLLGNTIEVARELLGLNTRPRPRGGQLRRPAMLLVARPPVKHGRRAWRNDRRWLVGSREGSTLEPSTSTQRSRDDL